MPGLGLAIVPHPVAKQPPDEIAKIAETVFPELVHLLEGDAAQLAEEGKVRDVPRKSRLRYTSLFEGNFNAPDAPAVLKTPDSYEAINKLFYQRGWTDGLPIVPPTQERYARMIQESGLDPDTVIGPVEPRLGIATVGKIAVNAIMAGCEAVHLPVVVAVARAMIQPQFNLKALQCTTHPVTVMTLVNG